MISRMTTLFLVRRLEWHSLELLCQRLFFFFFFSYFPLLFCVSSLLSPIVDIWHGPLGHRDCMGNSFSHWYSLQALSSICFDGINREI